MKKFKRFFAVFVCVAVLLGSTPLGGFVGLDLPSLFGFLAAAETYNGSCGENLTWALDTDSGELNITGTGAMDDWEQGEAPWYSYRSNIKTINIENGVTSIGHFAFHDCKNLTNITIPNNITTIGDYAFTSCSNITDITMPDSIVSIGEGAFLSCYNLVSITLSDSITVIPAYTFDSCMKLASIIIPEGVTSIGECAFNTCDKLSSITIGSEMKDIGFGAFTDCFSITDIYYGSTEEDWDKISIRSGNDPLTGATIHFTEPEPDEPTIALGTCGDNLTWTLYESGLLEISGNGTMTDWTAANKTPWYSYRTSVTSVAIGDGVTSIGKYAFISCTKLTSATIPTSVNLIEMSAFGNSRTLTDVHYGSDQDDWAKITVNSANNALDYAEFHYVFRLVNSGTFNENFKWELYSGGELTISGNGAMPDNISTDAYPWYTYRSKITSVIIGEGITSVGDFAFNGYNKITTVSIDNDVTQIGRSAFSYCSALTSITIPDKVTDIDERAFYSCSGLKELTMPVSAKIYNSGNVFYGCANIEKITLTKGNGTMLTYSTVTTAPADTVNYKYTPWYTSASNLKELTIEEGITAITPYAFYGCTGITSITIPDGVTSIGEYAFCGCNAITSVTIPDGVTTVGEYAFYNCTALESTYFTGNVAGWCKISFNDTCSTPMKYADNLYFGGELVTEVTIPETTTSIGSYAFYGCSNLIAVYYKGTLEQWKELTIGQGNDILFDIMLGGSDSERPFHATGKCGDDLEWILYADGELVISGTGVMYNYSQSEYAPWYNYRAKITSVTLPDGMTLIGNYAFYNCNNMKELTIPVSAKIAETQNYAFYNCRNIEKITITKGNGTSHNYGTNSEVPSEYYAYTPWYLSGCSTIVIADGVTSIGDYMFYRCSNLTYVTIADSVTSIGNYAFYNCNGMKELTIPVSTKIYNSSNTFYYCNYLEKVTFTKGNGTAQAYASSTSSSSTYYDYTPWYKSQCPTVVIADGVTSIGAYTFRYCEDIENVYYTGDAAGWCTINFSDYYSNPMYYASNLYFGDELVTEITIPETVTSIGTYVFYNCPYLTAIYYEGTYEQWKSVITIPAGNDALRNKITFRTDSDRLHYTPGTCGPDLEWILYADGELVISGTGNMKEPTDYSYVPWYKYRDKITSVIIGDSVTSIGNYAFYGCTNLKSLTLPDSITTIGNYAFYNCTGLNEILISSNITSIGQKAFSGCSGLTVARCEMTYDRWKEVTVQQDNTELTYALLLGTESERHFIAAGEIGENIMWYLYEDNELCITGEGDMASYASAADAPWYNRKDKVESVVVSDGITLVGAYAFSALENLTSVIVSDSVTQIQKNAFSQCDSLNTVYIFGYDTTLASNAFAGCYDANIYCHSGSTAHAYAKRNNLAYTLLDGDSAGFTVANGILIAYSGTATELVIPAGITAIGSNAFKNNDTIVSVVLPDSLTDIYTGAFAGCDNLERIIVPESVTVIASTAFDNTDAVFACVENSYAHMYALEHGITCELTNPVRGVELTSHNEYVSINGTVQLTVGNVQNKGIIWNSTDETIASVDENGLVTARKAGVVVITATTTDGYKDFCLIRVVGITASLTSGTVIDNKNSYIYGLDAGLDSISDYIELADSGCTLEYDTLSGAIGTGSVTNIVRDGEIVDSYTVIIFGDVDGNGWYDANDAFLVRMIANGLIDKSVLSPAAQRAADCNHDGEINELDFEILNSASLLIENIDQSATKTELESDETYIEYMSLIDQSAGLATEDSDPAPETNADETEIGFETVFAMIFDILKQIFAFVLSFILA